MAQMKAKINDIVEFKWYFDGWWTFDAAVKEIFPDRTYKIECLPPIYTVFFIHDDEIKKVNDKCCQNKPLLFQTVNLIS